MTDVFGCLAVPRLEEKDEARLFQMNRRIELAFGSGQFVCMGRNIGLVGISKTLAEVSASVSKTT